MPIALPTTLSSPPRRPSASERPITNSTLGPGIRMSTTEAITNAHRFSTGTI